MTGVLLAIETTGSVASVALFRDGLLQGEKSVLAERSHGREILPLVRDACPSDDFRADAVAVSAGPGSFTGIRVGMSAARALAFAWDARAIAVPTFGAWAEAAAGAKAGVLALRTAGADASYVQFFPAGTAPEEPQRVSHDELMRLFGKRRLTVVTAGPLSFFPPAGWAVQGDMAARAVGMWALRHWEDVDGVGFHPIYLRPPQAEQGGRGARRGRP